MLTQRTKRKLLAIMKDAVKNHWFYIELHEVEDVLYKATAKRPSPEIKSILMDYGISHDNFAGKLYDDFADAWPELLEDMETEIDYNRALRATSNEADRLNLTDDDFEDLSELVLEALEDEIVEEVIPVALDAFLSKL